MKFTHTIERSGFALLLALPLALSACDSDEGNSDTDPDLRSNVFTEVEGASPDALRGSEYESGMLRLVHLGVFPNDENTTVDIFVDGENSGVSISFKEGTDYVEVPVGSYTVDIVPSGGNIGDSVLTVPDFEIAAGDVWEVVAAGYVDPDQDKGARLTALTFPEDASNIPMGMTRFNVFHTAALAALTPIDVWVVNDGCEPIEPVIRDFEFGQAAPALDVPAATMMIGLDIGQDAMIDACFEIPEIGPDMMVNAFAVNDDRGDVSIVAHMPDGSIVEIEPK